MHRTTIQIDKKYSGLLMCLLIAFFMSGFMSFAITLINTDVDWGFIVRWLTTWCFSFAIGFPAALIVVPSVKKYVDKITQEPIVMERS